MLKHKWFWVVLLVLLPVIYVVAINGQDRAPSKTAAQFTAFYADRKPVPDVENGYVYVMGFAVANKVMPSQDLFSKFASDSINSALITDCKWVAPACLEALAAQPRTASLWQTAEPWLLERYRQLLAHSAWQESLPFTIDTDLPPFVLIYQAQLLYLMSLWESANSGDAADIQAMLDQDQRFWRLMLASSDILITKMLAVEGLRRNLLWTNAVLRELPVELAGRALPQLIQVPITDTQRSMLRCFVGEWHFVSQMLDEMELPVAELLMQQEPDQENPIAVTLLEPFIRYFFQRQDFNNKQAQRFAMLSERLAVPYSELEQSIAGIEADDEQAISELPDFSMLYNPVGNILYFDGFDSDFTGYAGRVVDLEGARQAALLTIKLRLRGVDVRDIPIQLANAELRDPYNGQPFVWDSIKKVIQFEGIAEDPRGTYAFSY